VRVGACCKVFVEGTFLRVARDHNLAFLAPFEDSLGSVELEATFLFNGAVAFDALNVEEGLNFARPQTASIRCRRCGDSGGSEEQRDGKAGNHGVA
jgi:hypothetical protein